MDVPRFSLDGYEVEALVCKVFDGDSIQAVFALPMCPEFQERYRWSCRIAGIDTPELRSKDTEVRKLAFAARDLVKDLVLGKTVRLVLGEFDKYGRVLCKVYDATGKPVASTLLERGLAREYNGGKREKWEII